MGWCLTLGATHGAFIAAHWPEQAQIELFGADGHIVAPHRAAGPAGTCKRVDGGYVVDGTWNYCSGIPYATHFIANVMVSDSGDPPEQVVFIVPRKEITILGDWGGDATLGMRASGSNSVAIKQAFVPAHHVIPAGAALWSATDVSEGTHGTRLHGNPMYLARMMGPYHASLVTTVVGAARAALDELEDIAKVRTTRFPPGLPWYQHVDVQRPFGQALMMTDTAEAILIKACEMYMDYCRRWAAGGYDVPRHRQPAPVGHAASTPARSPATPSICCSAPPARRRPRRASASSATTATAPCTAATCRPSSPTWPSGLARLHFGLPMGMYGI